jgi:hypothetical protein
MAADTIYLQRDFGDLAECASPLAEIWQTVLGLRTVIRLVRAPV